MNKQRFLPNYSWSPAAIQRYILTMVLQKYWISILTLSAMHFVCMAQQPFTHSLKFETIKSDIDLALYALQIGKIEDADLYLSSTMKQILDNNEKLQYFINYNAECIHGNLDVFCKLLKSYAEIPLEINSQNLNKLYALYLSYHNWLIYYNIPNSSTKHNLTICHEINILWNNLFLNIPPSKSSTNIVLQLMNESLIIDDGVMPSLAIDQFWCRYFELGSTEIEAILSDFVYNIKQCELKDGIAYFIQIADRLSLFDNISLDYARKIYASAAARENCKWREYALSRVASICCHFGEIDTAMEAIYIPRLFSDYQYDNINNYYIDVCAIVPYLEASLATEVVKKAYSIIKDSNISDRNWKCCSLLTIIGDNYYKLQKYSEAESYLIQALDLVKPQGKLVPIHTLNSLAQLYIHQGDYDFAEQLLKMVLDECNAHGIPMHIILYELYHLYMMKGDENSANSYLSSAFEAFKNELRQTLLYLPTQERSLYYQAFKNWELFSHIHESSPMTEYNIQLLNKGMLLQTDITIAKIVFQSNNDQLIKSYQELLSTNHKNNNQLYKLEQEFLQLFRVKGYNALSFMDIAYNDILSNLCKFEVAIEFINGYKLDGLQYYAALILRKDWDSPKMIPLCKKGDLEPLIKRLQDIYNSTSHRDSAESYIYRRLYTFVWSKLEPYINEGDNVYFSPSGLLHQINVEVLKDATGCLVNEKYNLFRVSSTRELCMEKPVNQWKTAVLFGDLVYDVDSTMMLAQSRAYLSDEFNNDTASRGFVPDSTHRAGWSQLSNTAEEVNAIDRLLSSKRIETAKYMQYAGNEESFKALSGKKTSIIHLATHGFFFKDEETKAKPFFEMLDMDQHQYRPDNSLKRSGLILAGGQRAWLGEPIPDNVEDGILLAEEVAAMDLNGTDLVVLSACETGLGEITSEGVFGLQRAFKKAGVQTLVMSLWKVHDAATSLMMRTFYKNLLDGKPKRDAFAMAQQTVKEKYEDPYYWASFIMLD